MNYNKIKGVKRFLDDYPEMSISPCVEDFLKLRGDFNFKAIVIGGPQIEDTYKLEILVSERFPYTLPIIKELGGKIPKNSNHHINPDGSLCLGSKLKLFLKVRANTTFNVFIEECLVPYLYAMSYKLIYKKDFIFGELDHGLKGIKDDYSKIFGLKDESKVIETLKLLGIKKRIANKKECPCGCQKRLGVCKFHFKLNKFRKLAPRSWFKKHLSELKH